MLAPGSICQAPKACRPCARATLSLFEDCIVMDLVAAAQRFGWQAGEDEPTDRYNGRKLETNLRMFTNGRGGGV